MSREGVIYRGGILYNKLPEYLRNEQNVQKFQTDLKGWIKENIAIKPFSKYPSLFHPRKYPPGSQLEANMSHRIPATQTLITHYFGNFRR